MHIGTLSCDRPAVKALLPGAGQQTQQEEAGAGATQAHCTPGTTSKLLRSTGLQSPAI